MLNIKKIKPRFTQVITTSDIYTEDQKMSNTSLLDTHRASGSLKEYQTVIAVGPNVRDIKEGDLVMINPKRYAQMKHQEGSLKDGVITDNPVVRYNIPMIELDYKKYLLLQDNDIDFVIEDYVEEKDPSDLIIPNPQLIV